MRGVVSGARVYGVRARVYGERARVYGVGARVYGTLKIIVSAPVPFWVYWGWNWVGLGWDWVWGDWGLKGWGLGLDNQKLDYFVWRV